MPRLQPIRSLSIVVAAVCVAAVASQHPAHAAEAGSQQAASSFTVRGGDVRVLCPLTIGGSFEAKTRMLNGTIRPGAAAPDPWTGELAVELSSLDTGIELRNQHLREKYLEVGKGPDYSNAVLKDLHVEGIDPSTPNGKGTFSGTLRLHGTERQVKGNIEVRRSGSGLRARASFPVMLEEFAIAKPRYLGVGVADQVTVRVTFDLTTTESTR